MAEKFWQKHPDTTGSLGCAISEAVEAATTTPGYRYVLGSVLNQVLLHQSVIGLETKAALDKYGVKPDIIIGCAGGGSQPRRSDCAVYGRRSCAAKQDYRIIAVEPASCPSFTRGRFAYDFCDTGMVCPLAKMYTLGSGFIPVCQPRGRSSLPRHELDAFAALPRWISWKHVPLSRRASLRRRSSLRASKASSPRRRAATPSAWQSTKRSNARQTGEEKTILFGLTGTGYFDLYAYESYNNGTMTDTIPTDEQLQKSFAALPNIG